MSDSLPASALHDRLEQILRQRYLREPVAGFRLPSERTLAREFSVSVTTLRKALDRLVAEGALERRHGSGTFVVEGGSALAAAKPIAVLCNTDLSCLRQPQFPLTLLADCAQRLRAQGYRVRIYMGEETGSYHADYRIEPEFLADVQHRALGGVIAIGTFPDLSWTAPLEQQGVPVVGLGELHRNMVTENQTVFIIRAAQRLLAMGRTRVAFIRGAAFQGADNPSFYPGKSHVYDEHTVRCLLESLGLEIRDHWMRHDWRSESPGAGWSVLREIWSSGDRPDGLIIGTSAFAEDICLAARECGIKTPHDLALVGSWFKDAPILPPQGMETLYSDIRQLSGNLVEMLHEAICTGEITRPRRIIDCLAPAEEPTTEIPEASGNASLLATL